MNDFALIFDSKKSIKPLFSDVSRSQYALKKVV
jgi:hypothetical protein